MFCPSIRNFVATQDKLGSKGPVMVSDFHVVKIVSNQAKCIEPSCGINAAARKPWRVRFSAVIAGIWDGQSHKHGRSRRVFVTKPFWVPVRQPHVILIKTNLIIGWIPDQVLVITQIVKFLKMRIMVGYKG